MGRHVLVLIAALALVMPVGCSEVIPDWPCRQVFRGNQLEGRRLHGSRRARPGDPSVYQYRRMAERMGRVPEVA